LVMWPWRYWFWISSTWALALAMSSLYADGGAETGGVAEAQILDGVQQANRHSGVVVTVAVGDERAQLLLPHGGVDEAQLPGQLLVEDDPPRGGLQVAAVHLDLDRGVVVHRAGVQRHQHLFGAAEVLAFALGPRADPGQVVDAQDHVLGGNDDGVAVGRVEQVARGQHQRPALDLRRRGQGYVDGHLVAVEIGVEGVTDQGVELDGLALHQHGFEGLDAQAVQRGRPVQKHRVLRHHLLQHRPDLRGLLLHQGLGLLDVVHHVLLHQLAHDEGLEELQGHLGGQPALVQLQLRADHDDRASGVVHPLAQKVLAEAPLLALEHVREGLQGPVGRPLDHSLLLGVVEQGVHRLLEHPFLVADDDVRGVEREQAFEAVVAVDHPAVQVVQVRGGEAAAVQLDHGPELRGDHGNHVQDHPLRPVVRVAELLHDLDALQQALVALAPFVQHLDPQLRGQGIQIQGLQQGSNGLCADAGRKGHPVALLGLGVLLLAEQLHLLQIGVARVDDDVLLVVQNRAQRHDGQVQQQPHAGGNGAIVPDVGNRRGQLDVPHALAPHPEVRHLHPAAVTDHPFVADGLELAAVALPLLGGAEDAFAEQAVLLRPQRAIVDGLGFLDLPVGPGTDLVRRGQLDHYVVEVLQFSHGTLVLL
jgi:hypothetical protein